MAGKLYLIPVTLGDDDFKSVIPEKVLGITRSLRHFIVEDIRSARRYLRLIDKEFPINDSVFFVLNEHTGDSELTDFLEPLKKGADTGIMSEAGLPGIADPGSRIVSLAHRNNIKVIPLSGPSSILLALISSGLNGQNFSFHGYLPVRAAERSARIRDIEKKAHDGSAQIFIETPYRGQQMLEAIMSVCQNETMLCIATDITLPSESIKTMNISGWKKNPPLINDRLVIFIVQ